MHYVIVAHTVPGNGRRVFVVILPLLRSLRLLWLTRRKGLPSLFSVHYRDLASRFVPRPRVADDVRKQQGKKKIKTTQFYF